MNNTSNQSRKLLSEQIDQLLETLRVRFERNMNRHEDVAWSAVQSKLQAQPEKLWSLWEMERTGGEPDVVSYD